MKGSHTERQPLKTKSTTLTRDSLVVQKVDHMTNYPILILQSISYSRRSGKYKKKRTSPSNRPGVGFSQASTLSLALGHVSIGNTRFGESNTEGNLLSLHRLQGKVLSGVMIPEKKLSPHEAQTVEELEHITLTEDYPDRQLRIGTYLSKTPLAQFMTFLTDNLEVFV
ncbi:hypothetical protein L3X38_002945 [Prunus dulcis]|uniref:Uncharacterized protein n=1 Tax=Prunus dulcis TaxID=3755 RepID=A0AAD4WUY4_PRUDU|nr:hypothetical protein L3X38_002945 [Prunus dulcis]